MSDFQWHEFDTETSAWSQLADLHSAYNQAGIAYTRALRQFLVEDKDRVAFLRQGLRSSTHIGRMSQQILRNLKSEEGLQLLPDILYAYCHLTGDGDLQQSRDFILSLPDDDVLNRIEEAAEPLLETGTQAEYRRLLELYELLDPALTYRLAHRASLSNDPEIKEAGEDFLPLHATQESEPSASQATVAGSASTMRRLWNTPEEDVAWKHLQDL